MASVSDQEGVKVEHIIQDAHSGAELEEWVRSHGRAKLFVESDSGMYDAINRGFLKATGDIVAWLNCDEQYLPGVLAKVAAFFERHPKVDVVFGDVVLLNDEGALLSYRRTILPSLLHIRLAHLNTPSCATFIRRSVIERGFLLQPRWKTIADAVWIADLIQAKLRMAILPEPLAAFTMTQENLGESSLAFRESECWKNELKPGWMRWMHFPVVALHRLRKLFNGAYQARNIQTALYTEASVSERVPVIGTNLSFSWTRSRLVGGEWIGGMLTRLGGKLVGGTNSNSSPKGLPFSFYQSPHWPFRYRLVLPILLTAVVLLAEMATTPTILVAPMLSTMLMLLLSFRLEPLQLVPFAAMFLGAISYAIRYLQVFDPENSADWIRMGLRLIGFFTATTLAVLFSKYRCEARARLDQTVEILTTMPMPVVISDAEGRVIFANDEAVEFIGMAREKLVGASYPGLLMADQDEGGAMRDYIKFFQNSPESGQLTRRRGLHLALAGDLPCKVEARFICLGEGEARHMVTVFKV